MQESLGFVAGDEVGQGGLGVHERESARACGSPAIYQ